jgi:predicted permease
MFGGAAGLGIAFAGTRLILHFAFPSSSGLAGVPIGASPSMPVLLFAFGISLLTGVAFGIGPAWMAARIDPIEALRGAGRSTTRAGSLPRKALVALQAGLSLALLSASGLLTTALQRIENQDFGFVQDRRLVVYADPRQAGYLPERLSSLYGRFRNSLAAIPGISAVALCVYSPMANDEWGAAIWVDGHVPPGPRDDNRASWDRVTPGYFDVIGNPIVRGRAITEEDTAASRHVAVVNEAFARKFFRNEDPIGRHFGQFGPGTARQYEIVGIARDARYFGSGLDKPVGAFFVLPEAQHDPLPGGATGEYSPSSHFLRNIVIELKPSAGLPLAQIRQTMASVDPDIPILSIRTMKEQVAAQFIQQRLIARLTSLFGVLSLVLASIGLYGVTAYNAERRVGEIGVRMALGADSGHIVRLILRGAFALTFFGLSIGLPLTFAAGRFLGNQLYGMNPYNPAVTLAAVVTLGLCAFAASLIPAFRASLSSPVESLRAE